MNIQSFQPMTVLANTLLQVVAPKSTDLTVKVLDVDGRMAKTLVTYVNSGQQDINLNFEELDSGSYILNAFSGGHFIKSFRFSKM